MFKNYSYKKVQILGIIVLSLIIFSTNIHFARAGSPYLALGDKWIYDNTVGSYGGYVRKCVVKFDWSWRHGWGEKRNEDGCKFKGQIIDKALNNCALDTVTVHCSNDRKSVVSERCEKIGWWTGMSQTKALLNDWNRTETKCSLGQVCRYDRCITAGQWCERCSNNIPCTKVRWYDSDSGCDNNWYNQRSSWTDNSCTNLCLQGQTCRNGICATTSSINKQSSHLSQPFSSFQTPSSIQSFHSVQSFWSLHPLRTTLPSRFIPRSFFYSFR